MRRNFLIHSHMIIIKYILEKINCVFDQLIKVFLKVYHYYNSLKCIFIFDLLLVILISFMLKNQNYIFVK